MSRTSQEMFPAVQKMQEVQEMQENREAAAKKPEPGTKNQETLTEDQKTPAEKPERSSKE